MASPGELTGAAVPPPPPSSSSSSSSSPSPSSPSGIPLENEDRSTSTIDFGRRQELRGLGEELIRLDTGRQPFDDYYCSWYDLFSDLVPDDDPDLHDTLDVYNDPDLVESHGEKLLHIVIRLASPQQWLEWITDSAMFAAKTGASGVFRRLLASWGGPLDDSTLSWLLYSAGEGGSVDILSTLIAAGAGPLVREVDEEGRSLTALHEAAEGGHRSFVAKLIEAGAPLDYKLVRGGTALTEAVFHRHKGVVLEMRAAGADVNAIDSSRRFNLPWMSSQGDRDSLQIAVENTDEDMVDILLEAGAKPSKEAMHALLLHTAARRGSCQLLNSLLLAGARVDSVDTSGRSALHLACAYSHPGAVDLLLRHNASVTLMSNGGFSPVDVVGAQVLTQRKWRMEGIVMRGVEHEWELGESLQDLVVGSWDVHPTTLNSAETSTVDTICDMLESASAWGRRGWLVMMRSRPLAEVFAEQPDRSHADAFTLHVRDIDLVHEASSNTAGLREEGGAAQTMQDGEHATADWSAVVIWLLRSCDDSLFRNIVRFL